ncbi:MAG: response regulator [Thermoanaerobaculaceae bacterium]
MPVAHPTFGGKASSFYRKCDLCLHLGSQNPSPLLTALTLALQVAGGTLILSSDDKERTSVQPKKILAVDDSRLMLRMYEVMLRGTPLVTAENGRQALDLLALHPDVDLVLLDINMPVMGGLDFLAAIAQDGRFSGISVIVISTEGGDDQIAKGLAAGAVAYLTKPFDSEKLRAAIAALPEGR